MTSALYKIDNTSPVLQYSLPGQWQEGDTVGDSFASSYFGNKTFTTSTVNGATASFSFNGTSVIIGGAKRVNHGPYSVNLDGNVSTYDGHADPFQFQVPLFEADNLKQGRHTVTITNQGTAAAPFIDIDFVQWNSTISGSQSNAHNVEDTDTSTFTYQPAGAWSTTMSNLPGFSGGTGHFTNVANGSVTIGFQGDAIDVMGAAGPDHALYTVQLDGVKGGTYNATKSTYYPQQLLYHADNLGPGKHSLKLTQQMGSQNSQNVLSIDFASITPYQGTKSGKLTAGAIAGIVIGVLLFFALLAAGGFFYVRKRKMLWRSLNSKRATFDKYSYPVDPAPYYAPPSYDIPPSKEGLKGPVTRHTPGPSMTSLAFSEATSFGGHSNQSHYQQNPYRYPMPAAAAQYVPPANMSDSSSSVSGRGRSDGGYGGTGSSGKQPRVMLPPSTQERLDHISSDELMNNRMQVPGREQDFGPIPVTARLPPDYVQATEPYRPTPAPF